MGPRYTEEDGLAIHIFNALADGMGGCDFGAGLDRMIQHFGIEDEEGLIDRLIIIKSYSPENP